MAHARNLCTLLQLPNHEEWLRMLGRGLEPSRMSEATSGQNQGATAEVDAIGELQLEQTRMGCSS